MKMAALTHLGYSWLLGTLTDISHNLVLRPPYKVAYFTQLAVLLHYEFYAIKNFNC